MGLLIKGDFESEIGQLDQLYICIDGFTYRKADNTLFAPVALFLDETKQRSIIRKLIDYTKDKNGIEIELPSIVKIPVVKEVETVEDIFETQLVEEEIPYISFDEEGEEVTKYRTVSKQVQVKVGEKVITVVEPDISILQQDVFTTIYKYIEKEVKELLPFASITNV